MFHNLWEIYRIKNCFRFRGDIIELSLINVNWTGKLFIFCAIKTILNNWSRAVLLNFLDTDLYERQGKAISNFEYALPEPQSDLAQEITKDPYNFDFVAITEDYSETKS